MAWTPAPERLPTHLLACLRSCVQLFGPPNNLDFNVIFCLLAPARGWCFGWPGVRSRAALIQLSLVRDFLPLGGFQLVSSQVFRRRPSPIYIFGS